MTTLKSQYLGALRTSATHLQSGQKLLSDAPTDNNGRGEAFSPTDLVAAALGSCMMTVMGIHASKENIDLQGLSWETTKIMSSNPRKISEIQIQFHWASPEATEEQIDQLKHKALHCPVALSIHPEIHQDIRFDF